MIFGRGVGMNIPASIVPSSVGTLSLDIANLGLEVLQLLLDLRVLLGHLLVLGLPLVSLGLEGLDFSLEVTGLDICLSEPVKKKKKRKIVSS